MIYRALGGLAVTTSLLACSSNTTSLGGPGGDANPTSGADRDAESGSGPLALPSNEDSNGGGGCSGLSGGWYVWAPLATETPCEYLLPQPPAEQSRDPQLDPATWNPHKVRIERGGSKLLGFAPFKESSDGCDGDTSEGWYYAPPKDGGMRTRFMACPKTCSYIQIHDSFIRMATMYSSCTGEDIVWSHSP
jgi:hypothetical protein